MVGQVTYVRVAFWVVVGLVTVGVSLMMAPFVSALLWATAFSILSYPLYARWKARVGETLAAALTTALVTLVVVIPFALVGTIAGLQVSAIAQEVIAESGSRENGLTATGIVQYAEQHARPFLESVGAGGFDLKGWVETNSEEITRAAISSLTRGAQQLVVTIVSLAIAIFTMFFMLKDGRQMLDPFCELIPLAREKTVAILRRVEATARSVFVGVLLVAVLQGTIAGITYALLGVPAALIWTVLTMILCVIPLLGAPVVYIPLAIKLFIDGQLVSGIILLAVGFGIVSNVDNLFRPWVIGLQTKMHYMTIFFSLLGGVLLFGPIGVMAGPMLTALALGLAEVVREIRADREGESAAGEGSPAAGLGTPVA